MSQKATWTLKPNMPQKGEQFDWMGIRFVRVAGPTVESNYHDKPMKHFPVYYLSGKFAGDKGLMDVEDFVPVHEGREQK